MKEHMYAFKIDFLKALVLCAFVVSGAGQARAQSLPGTKLWEESSDPATEMVAGINRYLDRELDASVSRRQDKWHRDFSSLEAYEKSVAANRERLRTIIGAVGARVSPVVMSYVASTEIPARVSESPTFSVDTVRWGVYPGVEAEGLLLEPKEKALANVVVMGDCDATPEIVVGLAHGLQPLAQTARLLAEGRCRVLVLTLIDRSDEFSGNPSVRMTNLPHREWIYRMAYETGRHLIGYEVDKVLAAVDWFTRTGQPELPVGVAGQGEGGLIAFYAAAVDARIDAAWVGGYFGPRERVWQEPIYRNVWSLLDEFGDAEIATLITPRKLLVEACRGPEITGPPPPRAGRSDAASGRLTTPDLGAVRAEWKRLQDMLPDRFEFHKALTGFGLDTGEPIDHTIDSRNAFLNLLGVSESRALASTSLVDLRKHVDAKGRMKRQVEQLVNYTQLLLRTSELRRNAVWAKADSSSPERWSQTTEPLRQLFSHELIGTSPEPSEPLDPHTRRLFDEPKWTGYAVQIPVWPDVFASGILLLPKDLKPDERRPVVVCQHGLESRADEVVNPRIKSVYNSFGAQLADRGYIVYAPQNPYIGRDTFRVIQRKANPLKQSLFSVIVRQHERTLQWLASLPQVDRDRIAFYGLSYGGKTAMRVPAILKGYCLSICSADFNEWVVKCTSIDRSYSYLYSNEYDMYEFGLAEGFNYAEIAGLIAPRPFMVERGHKDGVAPDEWIGYEFAKVRRLYDLLGIGDRAEIAYFNAGHMIDGKATFAFLAKHLNWPRGNEK
jgi:cephalosporin-C deacetylase-like acetyl esterase